MSEKHFRLELIRADGQPKCANCAFWDVDNHLVRRRSSSPVAPCRITETNTLDLSVCSNWRTADTQQEVISE